MFEIEIITDISRFQLRTNESNFHNSSLFEEYLWY